MQRLSLVHSSNYRWWAAAAVAIGTFTSVVDNSSLGIALPSVAEHFRTDLPTTQWVLIGYALTVSALLLPMGRLSDIVGRKRVYVSGWVVFILGGAMAGFSPNIHTLIVAKVLQGCGAAMTQGPATAILVSTFPANQRGKAFAVEIGAVGSGGIAGPALAGLLIGTLGWQWVFFSGIALSSLSAVAALMILNGRRSGQQESEPIFDWTGAALSTGALVIFLLGMTHGSRSGWASPLIGAAVLSSVFMLVAFVWWELRAPSPMMDIRLFKRKLFSLGITANFISFLGNAPIRFMMPFYLQAILGYTPQQIGLIMVPSALGMSVMGAISGRLSDRFGWRRFEIAGLSSSVAGLFVLSTLTAGTSLAVVMIGMVLVTSGSGIFYTANNSANLSAVERQKYGVVAGLLNLTRNSANVVGTALTTAIVTAVMTSKGHARTLVGVAEADEESVFQAFTSGLQVALLTVGSLLIVAIVLSWVKARYSGETAPQLSEEVQPRGVPAPETGGVTDGDGE